MRLSITTEARFLQTPDGAVWSDGAFHYGLWSRYLDVYESVNVIARVAPCSTVHEKLRRADGVGVQFSPLPCYLGPWQYLRQACAVKAAMRRSLQHDDAVLLNVPGNISNGISAQLASGRPYGVHVVGDGKDVFAPGIFKHPLRPFFRWWFGKKLTQQAWQASAALYVTSRTLQERYPSSGLMAGVSDVDLGSEAFVDCPRSISNHTKAMTIINIGSMTTQLIKGLDVLIDATALCVSRGNDLRLVLVGGGRYQSFYEDRVQKLGLRNRVSFLGQLPAGPRIREELDRADLFVLPSRIEGLPRALVEAMARALPCISTPVGGIPELLPPEDLVPVGNATALADEIAAVLANPERLAAMSARNLDVARGFHGAVLRPRWNEFLRALAAQTAAWNKSQHPQQMSAATPRQHGEVAVHA